MIMENPMLAKGHGTVDPRELAQALVSWERDAAAAVLRWSSTCLASHLTGCL
jgi:hypothetical protein